MTGQEQHRADRLNRLSAALAAVIACDEDSLQAEDAWALRHALDVVQDLRAMTE